MTKKPNIDYTSSRSEPVELTHIAEKKSAKGVSIEGKLRADADGNADNGGKADKLPRK